ncbi:MAG TPA: VOC family protein [Gaiellaceae bacterium]|jgi:catechol 2,3-dioxygenase-like lactoylglutathione lyase family enzyme|nr:VOC family protein [Gaiellaceae bacterium]
MAILGINHLDLFSPDPRSTRAFYAELLGAEELDGFHDPLRAGAIQLAFHQAEPDASIGGLEIAFDVDARGYAASLETARRLGALEGEEVRWNDVARSFYARDPDGRRIEFSHHDPGVFWRA